MAELVATFSRQLKVGKLVRTEEGPVSGRRYRAVCTSCSKRDSLTFTLKSSAERRLEQHDCGNPRSLW